MKEWGERTERISKLNKDFKDEMESDELIIKQLEGMFKENLTAVRQIMEKIKK